MSLTHICLPPSYPNARPIESYTFNGLRTSSSAIFPHRVYPRRSQWDNINWYLAENDAVLFNFGSIFKMDDATQFLRGGSADVYFTDSSNATKYPVFINMVDSVADLTDELIVEIPTHSDINQGDSVELTPIFHNLDTNRPYSITWYNDSDGFDNVVMQSSGETFNTSSLPVGRQLLLVQVEQNGVVSNGRFAFDVFS